jgi:hypothetical protein
MSSIASLTPTVCGLFGVEPPELSAAEPLGQVIKAGIKARRAGIQRCLLYSPDAVGTVFYRQHSALFEPVRRVAPIEVALTSVFPPKTPVCYASMFTGAPPESHGIRSYVKPVLRCDTLFDALGRAGRTVAIVAVAGSSMDLMFRKPRIATFPEAYDDEVTERAMDLIRSDRYDLIVAYQQGYDDLLHERDPLCPEAVAAVERHVASFSRLAGSCLEGWKDRSWLIAFAPDHGAHIDNATGSGTHGENIPDDMLVTHFFGMVSPGPVV